MVATDGAVYARPPGSLASTDISAQDFGAPDPAEFMDPEHGLPGWLASTNAPEETGAADILREPA